MLLLVAKHRLALGLNINTRHMMVAITMKYLTDTLNIIQTTWHLGGNRVRANEAVKPVGKLGRMLKGSPWIRYLIAYLYASIAFALAQNEICLNSKSSEFQRHIKMTKYAGFKNV